MNLVFIALEDFDGMVGGRPSHYLKNRTYTLRPGNNELKKALEGYTEERDGETIEHPGWIKEGKCALVGALPVAGMEAITGTAVVRDTPKKKGG